VGRLVGRPRITTNSIARFYRHPLRQKQRKSHPRVAFFLRRAERSEPPAWLTRGIRRAGVPPARSESPICCAQSAKRRAPWARVPPYTSAVKASTATKKLAQRAATLSPTEIPSVVSTCRYTNHHVMPRRRPKFTTKQSTSPRTPLNHSHTHTGAHYAARQHRQV
jgi:hypothetical protein